MDISSLYVTMYYGSNESLAAEPVTISSINREETPWDDRFVVIHVAEPLPDETDSTGDTNGNGYLDVYCGNYSSTFWNTDGVVAIDDDDDPGNGGIVDFAAYSNRDGSPNKTMTGYIEKASSAGAWVLDAKGPQESSINIGADGLTSFMSISRKDTADTNTPEDFVVTPFQTPGRENILRKPENLRRLIRLEAKRLYFQKRKGGSLGLPVFCRDSCNLRIRLFSPAGITLYRSELLRSVPPGRFEIPLGEVLLKRLPMGLIIGQAEAVASGGGESARASFFIVVMR